MTFDDLFEEDERQFNDHVKEKLENYGIYKLNFYKELEYLRSLKNSNTHFELIFRVRKYAQEFILFRSDDILKIFSELGFEDMTLFFIDIEDIVRELKELREQGYCCVKTAVITFIEYYLHSRVDVIVTRQYQILTGKISERENTDRSLVDNFFRRLEYDRTDKEKQSEFDKDLSKYWNYFIKMNNQTSLDNKSAKKTLYGDTDRLYLPGILSCFYYHNVNLSGHLNYFDISKNSPISKSKFLLALFNFFKLFIRDKGLLSEEEYEKKDDYLYGNYKTYKLSRLKKIIFKK